MQYDLIEYKSHNKSTKFKKLIKYYKKANLKNTIYNKKTKRKTKKNNSMDRADKYKTIHEYDHVCTYIECCKDKYKHNYDYYKHDYDYYNDSIYWYFVSYPRVFDIDAYAHYCNIFWMRWIQKNEKYRKKLREIFFRYEKMKQKMNGKVQRNTLVKFFCEVLPKFFDVKIFGNSVMSLMSNVECNVIELVFKCDKEKKKIMEIMEEIFFRELVAIQPDIPYINLIHPKIIENDVVSFLLNICGTSIKFVLVHENALCFYPLVFIEQFVTWDSKEFSFLIRQYSGGSNFFSDRHVEWYFNRLNLIGRIDDVNFNLYRYKIKENLENKRLTLIKNIIIDDNIENYNICEQRLSFLKVYHERIADGYTIDEPCPKSECVVLKQSVLKFCRDVFDSTKLIFDVSCLIFEYLYLRINDKDICTYCGQVFEDGIFLMVPLCDCGKKLYIDNDTDNNCDNLSFGFSKYCGWRQNYNNAFHMNCFISIATQMRLNEDYQECMCCDCCKYFALR